MKKVKKMLLSLLTVFLAFMTLSLTTMAAENDEYNVSAEVLSISPSGEIQLVFRLTDYTSTQSGIRGIQIDIMDVDDILHQAICTSMIEDTDNLLSNVANYQASRDIVRYTYVKMSGAMAYGNSDLLKLDFTIPPNYTLEELLSLPFKVLIQNEIGDKITYIDVVKINLSENLDHMHSFIRYILNGDGTKTAKCDICGIINTVNDAVYEGKDGATITWFIDSKNILRINGEGEMSDNPQWNEYADIIKEVKISEGITTISDNAFNNFVALEKINIPDSVVNIGANAFIGVSADARVFIQNNNYAVGYFNGNNFNVVMPSAENAVLTLDKEYIVAKVDGNYVIKAESTHLAAIKWFIEGESIEITPDGNSCTITGIAPGTSYVVATATFGDETIYERCRVDVTTEEPNVTITGAHLPATTVTTNIYSAEYPTFDILFDLEQNMMPVATFSLRGGLGEMSAENNGVAVDSAYFADSATAAMFGLELMADRTMAVVPLFDVTDAAVVKAVKSSYNSKVTVVVNGEEFTTTETLALKVTKKLPTVKTTAVKLNSFYAADTAPLVITSANGTVLNAEVDYSKATAKVPAIPEWLVFNDDMTVSLADGYTGKASGKVYLKVWVDGYAVPVSTTVSVSVANTAPKLKLSAASATLNTYRDKAVETQITLLSNDKKVAFDTIGVTDVKVADVSLMDAKNAKTYAASANYTVESYSTETGVIILDVAENCEATAGKILLEAYIDGALNPVQLPFTVSVYNKAPAFKLSKTSASISTMEATETSTVEISVVPTPADYKVTAENFSWTITDSKNKAFDVAPLDIELNGNKVTVSANSSTEAGVKYKVTFNLADCAKAAVLNVTVTKPAFKLAKTSVTVSPLAAADTFKTEIAVTPTPKDYVLTNNNFTWVITDAKNNVLSEAPLNVSFYDSSNTVTIASNAKSVPGGKYKVVFTMEGVGKPVTLNVTVANPTVKLAKTSLTLNVLNGDSAKVAVTPTLKDYVLTETNFEWKITDSKNNVLEPAPLDIGLEDNTVTVSTNSNTQMGQTYKVVYTLKETNKTVTMTVKTLAEKNSKITLTLSAKGKLETGKLQNGVTITPKWTNLLKAVDITENIKVYTTATAKGSVPVDVTDKFDIARNADGTYTIRFAGLNAMNSLNFKDKYTVTAEDIAIGTQNVSTAKAVSMSVTHTKPKVTQSVKEVKLYQNDRYSRGKVRITLNDGTMPKIASVQIADGGISEFYELVNLGGGWYGIEYKDNTIAPKIKNGTIKLNVFLQGNNPENNNPNATISVKVTNVKFK